MNRSKINLKMYEAYAKIINIKLFNDIVSFIVETTNIDCNGFINKLKLKNIWFERTVNNNIQEEYGFKYFGELLERYEQRIGTDIKDIRAIALSLGYSKELITDEMITGTQLVDFINKIKRLSENDMYLKAALYLYDENKYYNLFEEVATQRFKSTEDIVFVLSLFYDKKHGFDLLEHQLNKLLGKSKTISVMDNCGIYNWLIKNLYPVIKNDRRKNLEIFKALISIPTSLIKDDSKTYKILLENGYSKEEISFLNYICIFFSSIPKTVRIGRSIVEEKIAVNFCTNILNSETTYSDEIYELIYTMLGEYSSFDIKCYGYVGLKEAIIDSINIKVPKAFIKLYGKLDKRIYSFDVLDEKWNVVKEELHQEEYRYLFDNFLLHNNFNKEQIEQRIDKYNELTSGSYMSSFDIYHYGRTSIYAKLIEKCVINLEEQFNKYLSNKDNNTTEEKNMDLQHLREYISGIENRKSFEFIKYFLNLKEYTIKDIEKFRFNIGNLLEKSRYYYGSRTEININIKRNFLSTDEHKELLNWLENYIFNFRPNYYIDFVRAMLKDEFISTIIDKKDLRKLYFTLIEVDKTLKEDKGLREKYLYKEELDLLIQQEKEEYEKRKLMEKQKKENAVINKFNALENPNFKDIYEYCHEYRWYKEETAISCRTVKEYLNKNIENHNFMDDEIIYFNKICNLLIQQKFITLEELKGYIFRYARKGELV